MTALITVHSVAQGFNYSAYIGCKRDSEGVAKGTADKIIGGWAISAEQAKEQAREALTKE